MEPDISAALALHQAGRHGEAEAAYRAILDRDPDDPNAAQLLGTLLAQTGRAAEAEAPFRRVLATTPTVPGAWSNLAAAVRMAGKPGQAVYPLHRALALDPAFADGWVNLGNAAKAMAHIPTSRDAFRRALAVNPAQGQARRGLDALLAEWGGRLDEAARLAAVADRPGAEFETLLAAALAGFAIADLPRTAALCRRALALRPDHTVANDVLGRVALEMCGVMSIAPGKPFHLDEPLAMEGVRALVSSLTTRPAYDDTRRILIEAVSVLVMVGMDDDDLLRDVARIAWRRLHEHPKDTRAAAVIGFHLYRRDRLVLASHLLNRRFLPRFTAEEIAADHELGIWAMLRADDAFLDALPSGDTAVSRLIPMVVEHDVADGQLEEPFVMFSCDEVYFRRFAPSLLESAATAMPGATVVAHVVNPSAETLADAARWAADPRIRFGFSHETPPGMENWPRIKRISYFAAARFMRAYAWKRRLARPLIVVDTDAYISSDLRKPTAEMAGFDVGLLIDPRRRGPSRDVTVCFNHYNATPGGDAYLGRVAAYIGSFLERDAVYWLLDQTAHYAVLDQMRRRDGLRVREYDFLNFPHCRFIGAK